MQIIVVGGGFTGTLLSYFLVKQGHQVELHEKSERWGGLLQTETTAHGDLEWAANAMINSGLIEDVAKDIGVELIAAGTTHKARYLFGKNISRWPLTIFESIGMIFRFLRNWLLRSHRPRALESLHSWGLRVLGIAATEKILALALLGIYASDIKTLSANLVLGRFFETQRNMNTKPKLRGSVAPTHGMNQWIDQMILWLEKNGAQLQLKSTYTKNETSKLVVDCTSGSLIDSKIFLKKMDIVTCSVYFDPKNEFKRGFGVLFDQSQNFKSLGCLFESDLFPDRYTDRCERFIFSDSFQTDLMKMNDKQILELCLQDRSRYSESHEPLYHRVLRMPQALPVYSVELERQLSAQTKTKNKIFMGNQMGRIGLGQIAVRCQALASDISKGLYES
jgi:protoporphyrinogen/coproporphyrinogen III oxidase